MSDLALNLEFTVDDFVDLSPTGSLIPFTTNPTSNRWPPQLVFDLALGLEDTETLLIRHSLSQAQLDRLYTLPPFQKELASLAKELHDNNTIFKSKAKVQADSYLQVMDDLMHAKETPAGTKLSIFQTLVKLAELEPEKRTENQGNTQMRLIVEWVGPSGAPPAIDITP